MSDDHLPELLTVAEAAVVLRMSAPTVRRALARGELTGLRIGRQWRVERDSLTRPQEAQAPRRGHDRHNIRRAAA